MLADAAISPGVMKPLDVLVEHGGDAAAGRGEAAQRCPASSARPRRRTGSSGPNSLVEAFPAIDGVRPRHPGDHRPRQRGLDGTDGTLTGLAAVDRDFLHALFGSFPYVLGARPAPDADPAHPGVPLDRARGQGGRAEPRSRSPRRSGSSSSSSSRGTARRSGTSRRPSRSPPGSR